MRQQYGHGLSVPGGSREHQRRVTALAATVQPRPGSEQLRHGGMDIIEKVDRKAFIDALKPLDPEFERRFGKETLELIRSTP